MEKDFREQSFVERGIGCEQLKAPRTVRLAPRVDHQLIFAVVVALRNSERQILKKRGFDVFFGEVVREKRVHLYFFDLHAVFGLRAHVFKLFASE